MFLLWYKNPKILKIHWWDDATFDIKKNVTQWTTPKIFEDPKKCFLIVLDLTCKKKHVDTLSLKLIMGSLAPFVRLNNNGFQPRVNISQAWSKNKKNLPGQRTNMIPTWSLTNSLIALKKVPSQKESRLQKPSFFPGRAVKLREC